MNDIIIKPKNKKQSDELQHMLEKMNIKFVISNAEKEDQALLKAMLEMDTEEHLPIAGLYASMLWN